MMADVQKPPSSVQMPAAHLIRKFEARQLRDRTVGYHLEKGYSLCICCKDCMRMVEWTPPELLEKFGKWPHLPLAELVARLSCSGEKGCGSDEVALFPHLYDGEWIWPPASQA